MECPWNPTEFHGAHVEMHRLPWNYIEFHRIPWNSTEFREVPCMELHGIPWGNFTRVNK